MNLSDYLVFVGEKLKEAAESNNKEEWIRLANALIETIRDQIRKLQ